MESHFSRGGPAQSHESLTITASASNNLPGLSEVNRGAGSPTLAIIIAELRVHLIGASRGIGFHPVGIHDLGPGTVPGKLELGQPLITRPGILEGF